MERARREAREAPRVTSRMPLPALVSWALRPQCTQAPTGLLFKNRLSQGATLDDGRLTFKGLP